MRIYYFFFFFSFWAWAWKSCLVWISCLCACSIRWRGSLFSRQMLSPFHFTGTFWAGLTWRTSLPWFPAISSEIHSHQADFRREHPKNKIPRLGRHWSKPGLTEPRRTGKWEILSQSRHPFSTLWVQQRCSICYRAHFDLKCVPKGKGDSWERWLCSRMTFWDDFGDIQMEMSWGQMRCLVHSWLHTTWGPALRFWLVILQDDEQRNAKDEHVIPEVWICRTRLT